MKSVYSNTASQRTCCSELPDAARGVHQQARRSLLTFGRKLVGSVSSSQQEQGAACRQDADCGSGICADQVRSSVTIHGS